LGRSKIILKMTEKQEIYKCAICGNIVEVLDNGVGTLVCCNQNMNKMEEKISEEGNEKHKPILEKNEEGVEVKVSSIPHPMEDKHFIEWIEITTKNGTSKKFLKPGEKPEKKFPVGTEIIKVRSYCNIHGLWKNDAPEFSN
jgi:superoxide reductase